jgi:hypothetical protein
MEKEVVLLNSKGKFGLYLDSGIYELNELFVLISFPSILCGLCQSNSFGYVFIGRVLSSKSSYNLFMIIFPCGDEENVVLSYHDSLMASKVHKYEIRSCFFLCSIQEILLLMMSMGEG